MSSSFMRPQGTEAVSNMPVARCASERESGAASPVAETASRFQGGVPMAESRMGAGIGRHDEVRGEVDRQ